jgi:hypothetical protein
VSGSDQYARLLTGINFKGLIFMVSVQCLIRRVGAATAAQDEC